MLFVKVFCYLVVFVVQLIDIIRMFFVPISFHFVFIVLLCQLNASIWFVFVDQPIQRLFNSLLFKRQFIANKGK